MQSATSSAGHRSLSSRNVDELVGFGDRAMVIGCPRVIGEQPPVVLRDRLALADRGQDLRDRVGVAQRDVENRGVALDIDTARQARDLGAVGAKQDHRRVTDDPEVLALLLRARGVAIEIDGHEQLRALLEFAPVEDRRLDLRAGRAPLGAPVQVQRLVRRLGRGERGVHVASEPVDAGRMMGVGQGRRSSGGRNVGRGCRCGRLATARRQQNRENARSMRGGGSRSRRVVMSPACRCAAEGG